MKALGNVPADMIGTCMDDLTAADEPELPEAGTALHDDLPEPVSAVRSVRIIRIIPAAAAACLLIGVFAAVYPKLRIQTPEITEPPAAIVTTETTAQNTPETTAVTVYTTAVSQKATYRTTAETVSQIVTETVTDVFTDPVETQPDTVSELQPQTEATMISTAITETAPQQPDTMTVPLWKGSVSNSSSELIIDEAPNFSCLFRPLPFEQPDPFFELSNQYESLREEFSIPQDFDLTQEPLLDITIITGYKDTAITGCRYTQNGLNLTVSYLKTNEISEYTVRYAIPLPENLKVEPENCTVEYVALTDEDAYQALLTDSLSFELDH